MQQCSAQIEHDQLQPVPKTNLTVSIHLNKVLPLLLEQGLHYHCCKACSATTTVTACTTVLHSMETNTEPQAASGCPSCKGVNTLHLGQHTVELLVLSFKFLIPTSAVHVRNEQDQVRQNKPAMQQTMPNNPA